MDRAHSLELRITQGRLNRRLVTTVGVLAAGCGALAVILAVIDLPGVIAAGAVAVGLGIAAWLGALAGRGADPALTSDGIRVKAYPFDRVQVMVPWREVERTWIARVGAYDYLFILPTDPRRHRSGRGVLRAAVMALTAARHGSALLIHLPADGVSEQRIRSAVEQFSGGTVRVGPAPM